MIPQKINHRKVLGEAERDAIRALIKAMGENPVAEAVGVSRMTLGRALAGLTVQKGTLLLFERFLQSAAAVTPDAS